MGGNGVCVLETGGCVMRVCVCVLRVSLYLGLASLGPVILCVRAGNLEIGSAPQRGAEVIPRQWRRPTERVDEDLRHGAGPHTARRTCTPVARGRRAELSAGGDVEWHGEGEGLGKGDRLVEDRRHPNLKGHA